MLDFGPDTLASLLDPLALGWLSGSETSHLVHPITTDKVLTLIRFLTTGYASGPDGLTVKFYKVHANILAPLLASLYSHCLEVGALPPTMADAHIILIHKPNKDPKLCASYRPIALLNNDLKILSKLITATLNPLLPFIIDSDQTGFMVHKSTDIKGALVLSEFSRVTGFKVN